MLLNTNFLTDVIITIKNRIIQKYQKKNAEVQFLGTLSNFFENYAEIRYNGIVYTVYTSDIEIKEF